MKLRLNLLAVLTISIGYIINEDTLGGARYDFWNFHLPSVEHFIDDMLNITDYPSASGPLYYLLASSFYKFVDNTTVFRIGHAIIFIAAINIWYSFLRLGLNSRDQRIAFFLTLPLIFSPVLRSTVVWPTTDSFTILMLIYSVYATQRYKFGFAFGALAIAFLTRQYNILWIPLIGYFWYTNGNKRLAQLIPLLVGLIVLGLLIVNWGGLAPVSYQHHSEINFFGFNIASGFIILYMAPLMKWKDILMSVATFKTSVVLFVLGIIAVLLNLYLYNNFNLEITGGGIPEKILGIVSVELGINNISKIVFYSVSLIAIAALIHYDKRYMLIVIGLMYFPLTTILFQKYGDTIIYIFTMLLLLQKENFTLGRAKLIGCYYMGLYMLSFFYYMSM